MRVAYICTDPGVPAWGNKGCSIHVQGILRALLRKGIDVDLLALRLGGACPPGLESVEVHHINGELPKQRRDREQALQRLNDSVGQLLGALGSFDFVYERYALFSYAGVEFARQSDIPGLLEVNAPLIKEQERYRALFDEDGALEATRRAFYAATALLAVSDETAAHVRDHGIADNRICVLPNAVDPWVFRRQEHVPERESDHPFTIGFTGSLKPWHAVDQLIAAYASLWDHVGPWRLLIAGDGPERGRLNELVAALPARIASSIDFLGVIPHAAIPRLLATVNAAVVPGAPSSGAYFSPLKLFEYMAAGVPVVAARFGQIPSLVQHGVTGLLYEPGDTRGLMNALLKLRTDQKLAAFLGERAHREVFDRHTWDRRCDSILELVERARHHAQIAN
jgi:glycosyltransferase involved in cell wall biosynthesis